MGASFQASAAINTAAGSQQIDQVQPNSTARAGTQRMGVKGIRFERKDAGAGEVRIQMSGTGFSASAKKIGKIVYVDIPGAFLTKTASRKNNLSKFDSAVNAFSSKNLTNKVQVKIDTDAGSSYDSYQVDDMFVVTVTPKKGASSKYSKEQSGTAPSTAESRSYGGDRLSLNFQDIEIRTVLQLIADFTDLNIVASDSVQGNITLRLKNVPWDQALDIILKSKGLDKRREGNILLVAPAAEIEARELKELEASKRLEQFEPLITEHLKVKYADASEIFNLFLNTSGSNSNSSNNSNSSSRSSNDKGTRGDDSKANATGTSILSDRGSVIVDERTNSLFVTETAERLAKLKVLLNKIDIPIRQVMVEARIVIANKSAADRLGVSWGGSGTDGKTTIGGAIGGMIADYSVVGNTGIKIGRAVKGGLLDLQLMALEESGNGEVISRPKVITGDKKQATIESGSEIPYVTIDDGTATTEFKPVVLKLDVTPYITPDGRVIMDLVINQDSVGENVATAAGDIPRIDKTELKTQVLASNGETVVLGGVFIESDAVTDRKTPLLGDLPGVGKLFSSQTREVKKAETLIFITPKIIDDKLIR
ncbi:MAG: type IV pilus secretin PilQ [Pseudomonadota bacterium]